MADLVRPAAVLPSVTTDMLIAQSIGEYGGAGGGIVGAIERVAGSTVGAVSNSLSEHTIFWILGACVVALWLFRRR